MDREELINALLKKPTVDLRTRLLVDFRAEVARELSRIRSNIRDLQTTEAKLENKVLEIEKALTII